MIGSVPNIIIGSAVPEHMNFMDFIVHMAPATLVMMPLTMLLHKFYFRKSLRGSVDIDLALLQERYKIRNKPLLFKAFVITASCVVLFFLHPFHHLDTAWIATLCCVLVLVVASPREIHHAMTKVEWDRLELYPRGTKYIPLLPQA